MFRIKKTRQTGKAVLRSLTPKLFYDLAEECQTFADDLARLDPLQVHLQSCHRYNEWLPTVRSYDKLAQRIVFRSARPIARWQLLTLGLVSWVLLALVLRGRVDRMVISTILGGWMMGLIVLFFIPQRIYGTTVELLEGRLLLLVETMQQMLVGGEIAFSEGAYFRAKEMLEATQHELRQQIDLAHRSDHSFL